jgi:hypothetical protein
MTDVPNFAGILDMPMEAIKAPGVLPTGTYRFLVDGEPKHEKAGQNNIDCYDFNLKPLEVVEGVDQDKLAEVLNGAPLSEKRIKYRLFVTQDSAYRLKRFLVNDLGIEPSTLRRMVPDAENKQVYAKLDHKYSKDGLTTYVNVVSTARV